MGVLVAAADHSADLQLTAAKLYANTAAAHVQTEGDSLGVALPACHGGRLHHHAVAADRGGYTLGVLLAKQEVPGHPTFGAQAVPTEGAVATLPGISQHFHGTGDGVFPAQRHGTGVGYGCGEIHRQSAVNLSKSEHGIVYRALGTVGVDANTIGNSIDQIHSKDPFCLFSSL